MNDLNWVLCFVPGEKHFTEALNLVKDQRLYSEALGLYPTDSPQYKVMHILINK